MGTIAKARIVLDKPVKENLVEMLRLSVRPDARIEVRRAGLNEEHKSIRIALRGVTTSEQKQSQQSH